MSSTNYKIVEETPEVLCIRDLGPWDQYKTVTNAAEEVVMELASQLNGRDLHYIDSDGRRDQILYESHANGFASFTGFKTLGARTI